MAYANILDTILNEPRQGSKTASTNLADSLLDASPRQHQRSAAAQRAMSVVAGEGELAEAAMKQASRRIVAFTSIEDAVTFGKQIPSLLRQASPRLRQKVSSAEPVYKQALRRLERITGKSASQMKMDGASKIADYMDPKKVPSWAGPVARDLRVLAAVRHEIGPKAKTAATDPIVERSLSDSEVSNYITRLLNEGARPVDVEAKLKKLAELQVFNHSFAFDKLKNDAGLLGYTYMEPSAFLDGCNSAYQRMNTKLGGIKAKSIKQAKTCQGCSHFQKAAKHCNLFRLPIVANSKELFPIINNLTGGLSKSAAKAALVAQHNGETSRVSSAVKTVSSTRTVDKTSTLFGARRREKKATPTLAEVQQMHNAGDKLSTIFQRVASKANSRHAKDLLKTFVAGLKGTKTKVALTQIDCSLLKNKLATSNGIVGASKCASCTYRSNMSCGLTGGTLLSFPGMEHDSVKRAASSKVKDGSGLVREFDIAKRAGQMDIDIKGPDFADINLTGPSKVDL